MRRFSQQTKGETTHSSQTASILPLGPGKKTRKILLENEEVSTRLSGLWGSHCANALCSAARGASVSWIKSELQEPDPAPRPAYCPFPGLPGASLKRWLWKSPRCTWYALKGRTAQWFRERLEGSGGLYGLGWSFPCPLPQFPSMQCGLVMMLALSLRFVMCPAHKSSLEVDHHGSSHDFCLSPAAVTHNHTVPPWHRQEAQEEQCCWLLKGTWTFCNRSPLSPPTNTSSFIFLTRAL